jgi:hypothetical protein
MTSVALPSAFGTAAAASAVATPPLPRRSHTRQSSHDGASEALLLAASPASSSGVPRVRSSAAGLSSLPGGMRDSVNISGPTPALEHILGGFGAMLDLHAPAGGSSSVFATSPSQALMAAETGELWTRPSSSLPAYNPHLPLRSLVSKDVSYVGKMSRNTSRTYLPGLAAEPAGLEPGRPSLPGALHATGVRDLVRGVHAASDGGLLGGGGGSGGNVASLSPYDSITIVGRRLEVASGL